VPAEVEKALVDADGAGFEKVLPDAGDGFLHRRPGRDEIIAGDGHRSQRSRFERLAVGLAARAQR